jgi:mannose-1-phosphate guanylyltransferase/mannose-6-phosphate isomerase
MLSAVILCGGSGTRLWPASRKTVPKQFVRLTGARSMFQETLDRVNSLPGLSIPLIVTGAIHKEQVEAQLAEIGLAANLLVEPEGRESGPAIAAAALHLLERDPDAIMLVLAADHHIGDAMAFREIVPRAVSAAAHGRIVTFGMRPDHPATGYGYIAPGEAIGSVAGVRRVLHFAEKPAAEIACDYLAAGYLWNSGNFVFRADVLLGELARFEPAMLDAVRRSVALGAESIDGFHLELESFCSATRKPIDTAVMERTAHAVVLPVEMGWSDIGTWNAVWEASGKDEAGNVISGDAVTVDTRRSLVRADNILVATAGVEDLVIVATPDAVLVCRRDASQSVRRVVERLMQENRVEATLPPDKRRP